jgi:hypothetical protein
MNPLFGIAATAMQDPNVQAAAGQALGAGVNALGAGVRGAGRIGGYLGEGYTNNIAQPIFNKLGDIGNQYLPSWLSGAGSAARRGLYGLGQAAVGAQGNQGIWDALNNRNLPQGPMGAMQALGDNQGQMTPQQMMQQYYEQQIQQPINVPYQAQQQQMMNQFNQQTVPGLAERFSGMGGQRSNAFGQQLGAGGADLMQNLEALREQSQLRQAELNQGRLGQIGGYLGGQQGLGMRARELAQHGTIANREAQLRAMGLMQGANQGQQQDWLRQLLGRGELQGRLAGLGLGRNFDVLRHGGAPANIGAAANGTAEAIGTGVGAYQRVSGG